MSHSIRTGSVAILVATATLATGCGGGGTSSTTAAVSQAAAAVAAESSASAAIAALTSRLGALTASPPAPAAATSAGAAATSAAPASAVPASAAPATATPAAAASASVAAPPAATSAPAIALPAGASAAIAAAGPSAAGVLGLISTLGDVSKQCAAIPIAQVQALVKAPITGPANDPLQCGWKGTDLHVSLSPDDTGQKYYKALLSTDGHPIAGLGDAAQWFQPINGVVPDVNSRKGSLTCYVQGVGDLPSSTMPYAGKDPFYTTKLSDALAYANKEAKLCADIFAVSKT